VGWTSNLGWGTVAGSWEHGNESLGFIENKEFPVAVPSNAYKIHSGTCKQN
jgi:hypothetical protein